MTIKLFKSKIENGKEILEYKTFTAPNPKARTLRNTAALLETIDINNLTVKALDEMINYIVDVFGRQFTTDDVEDGLPAESLVATVYAIAGEMTDDLKKRLSQFPNVGAAE